MKLTQTRKFWITLVVFSLMGQIAWVVENMYFNVFIYKMFHASASSISLMVSASAVAATLTTWLMGALSDKIGKRKQLICFGYILWGGSILTFAFIRMDILTAVTGSAVAAAALGVSLVIIMDCVMTFFGSTANDACFNAWLTDCGDESNRGKIEGINSMMPLIAILIVFGGFMPFDLNQTKSWTFIYIIIGSAVIVIGILGFFLIGESAVKSEQTTHYWRNVIYSFRPSVVRENKLLYMVVGAFAVFGISIQIFMPYLILYYEKTLGMENYVLILAPAIILAAVITAFYGKLYDRIGFQMSVVPTVISLMAGYVFLFWGRTKIPVFVGSLFMMTGYLTGMAIFGAMIRDHIPKGRAGLFQGLRIFGQVFVPGIVGPSVGAVVLKDAETIVNSDGTTSFLPNQTIYLAAFIAAVVLLFVLKIIFLMIQNGHYELKTAFKEGDWSTYPRPQFKRESYFCLNGIWQCNGKDILIPFPPQAKLSRYVGHIGAHLTYEKHFSLPPDFVKDRVLLHFGAVDQVADIYINGKKIAHHEGGYLPFEADITDYLKEENELLVKVTDHLSLRYPYGKQKKKRGGMWYTPVSGIWQTVWLESVDLIHICGIRITPEDKEQVTFELDGNASEYEIVISLGEFRYQMATAKRKFRLDMRQIRRPDGSLYEPIKWTVEHPHLYDVKIFAKNEKGSVKDEVSTYFALRTVTLEEVEGVNRICLNNTPVFLHGVLDQGYFPDGLFLPANENGYKNDILAMKSLGFNMLRKHIKVEPESFYYECDRLGMLVMQDMVNNGAYSFIRDTALPTLGKKQRRDTGFLPNTKRKKFFIEHSKETIRQLYNHPCIIGYTIFNEGWGQFDSDAVGALLRQEDHTRFMDLTSGWFAQKNSDVESLHIYFNTVQLQPSKKPMIVSECGGYSCQIESHTYSRYGQYGYGDCKSGKELTKRIVNMYEEMILPAISKGLCGCVYTQLSDVEDETNGFYTYDRKVCKVDENQMKKLGERLKREIDGFK